MSSPLHLIIASIAGALAPWAAGITPKGTVDIAPDAEVGYVRLGEKPAAWKLILWCEGDDGSGSRLVTSKVKVGFACARGMTIKTDAEVVQGRENFPAVIEFIEAINARLRGLYDGPVPPADASPDSCFLLSFKGWRWSRWQTACEHHTAELEYTLTRQLPARSVSPIPLS